MITFKSINVDGYTLNWEYSSIEELEKEWWADFPNVPSNDDVVFDVVVDGETVVGFRESDERWFINLLTFFGIKVEDVVITNMKDTLGKKIEYSGFNSYDIAIALMELCGFDRVDGNYDYSGTEYFDLYVELESELFNLGVMAKNEYNRDSIRTLWNVLGMIGELGGHTGNWHTEEKYDFEKGKRVFPSHEEY